MKRPIVTLLCAMMAAALLAGCGPDMDATPAVPESDPTATGENAPAAEPSGNTEAPAEQKPALRPITQGADHAYYTFGQGQGEDGMHLILYAIDYDKQQAAPVCTKAGCSHDTPDCEAWLPDQNYRTIGSDGQEVFTLCNVVGSDEAYLESASLSGGGVQTLAALPVREGQVYDWTLGAADDEQICLGAVHYDAVVGPGKPVIPAAAVVSRADGTVQLYDAPDQAAVARPDGATVHTDFAGAEGRSLYFLVSLHSQTSNTQSGCELWAFDVDTAQWQQVTGFGGSIAHAGTEYYQVTRSARPGQGKTVIHVDEKEGSIRTVDVTTGEETFLCTGLPAAPGEYDGYDVTRLQNWYTVVITWRDIVSQQDQIQWFLVPAEGGEPVPMELYQYSDVRSTQTVHLIDECDGVFYCQYDITNEPYAGVGKDGVAGTFDNYHLLYGLLTVEDALASRPAYTEVFVE